MCRLPQHDMTGVLSRMYIRFISVVLEGRKEGREEFRPYPRSTKLQSAGQPRIKLPEARTVGLCPRC